MIETIFVITVLIVFFVIFWANNTLRGEYQPPPMPDQKTIEQVKSNKDDEKKDDSTQGDIKKES